jgi:hypothetical protein
MAKTMIEKMEEAAGIKPPEAEAQPKVAPPAKPPGGFVAPPHVGPKPWKEKGGRTEEPAHGKFEHNSPAKPL